MQSCKDAQSNGGKISTDIIISGGILVTSDSKKTVYDSGAVAISGSQIIAVGPTDEILEKYSAKEVIDAKGKIIMPGLVNTHTHMAMTVFRGFADDLPLQKWLNDNIFPLEKEFVNAETVRKGASLAMIEMIHSGTTTFNNMYFFQDETAKAAQKIGMRGIVAESLIDFPVPNSKDADESVKYTEMLFEKYKNDPLVKIGVAVHAPYTCSSELIQRGKKLADKHNTSYHIHVSETQWEVDEILKKYGKRPVQYLDSLGIMTDNVIAAHCVKLDEEDINIIAKNRVGVAHNPECNMKLCSGVAPIPQLLKANAKVGLGTDGPASNNNLNMIEEMHTMALVHKLTSGDPTVMSAEEVVRAATIGGAQVLGLDKEIGSLEAGKKADIILIDTKKPGTTPVFNVYSAIVYSVNGADVSDVVINGNFVLKNNVIITVDENKVMEDVDTLSKKIVLAMAKK